MRLRATVVIALLAGFLAGTAPARAADPVTYRIWPLGDSITLGVTGGGAWIPGGYRAPLDADLSAAGLAHLFVGTSTLNPTQQLGTDGNAHHDGHGGYRIDQISSDLTGVASGGTDNGGHWLTSVSADVVVIHLGTNDILQSYDPGVSYPTATGQVDDTVAAQRHQFVGDMTKRLGVLLQKLYAGHPQLRVVLAQIAPIETGAYQPVTRDFSYGVAKLASYEQGLGRRVVVADVYDALVGMTGSDGIHPTADGYTRMASVLSTAISQAVAAP